METPPESPDPDTHIGEHEEADRAELKREAESTAKDTATRKNDAPSASHAALAG